MSARVTSRLHRFERQLILPEGRCRDCPPLCLIGEGEAPPRCPSCGRIGNHMVIVEEIVHGPGEGGDTPGDFATVWRSWRGPFRPVPTALAHSQALPPSSGGKPGQPGPPVPGDAPLTRCAVSRRGRSWNWSSLRVQGTAVPPRERIDRRALPFCNLVGGTAR
jgi:hypothetical protein